MTALLKFSEEFWEVISMFLQYNRMGCSCYLNLHTCLLSNTWFFKGDPSTRLLTQCMVHLQRVRANCWGHEVKTRRFRCRKKSLRTDLSSKPLPFADFDQKKSHFQRVWKIPSSKKCSIFSLPFLDPRPSLRFKMVWVWDVLVHSFGSRAHSWSLCKTLEGLPESKDCSCISEDRLMGKA